MVRFSIGLESADDLIADAEQALLEKPAAVPPGVANGRRIVVVVKTGTYYECVHLGLFLPYATPAQYPYPLVVGGSYNGSTRWSNAYTYRNHLPRTAGYSGAYWSPTGGRYFAPIAPMVRQAATSSRCRTRACSASR